MFTPMFHGQNRGSNYPPIRNEIYQWWNCEDGNYVIDNADGSNQSRFTNLAPDLPPPPNTNRYDRLLNRANYAYTGTINNFDFYGDIMFLEEDDSTFGGKNSFLTAESPSELGKGHYRMETMDIIDPPPLVSYKDATLIMAIEYAPSQNEDAMTFWSWQTENSEEFALYEYVMDYTGFSLNKYKKKVLGWEKIGTAGSFTHPTDPALGVNKYVIALTSRSAYINGVKVMDASITNPINVGDQMRLDQFTSLFTTANIYKTSSSLDTPLTGSWNIGKFSEGLFYPRALIGTDLTRTMSWMANRNGIVY